MKRILQKGAIGLVLLGTGALVGGAMTSGPIARGQNRTPPPQPAFQSGGQLSVPILREIAATLAQIDARLARLEKAADKLKIAGSASPNRRGLGTVSTD
jgi:hypothetical protein